MSKAEVRAVIAALRPPAEAFSRAQRKGYVALHECGWIALDMEPAPPANPDQLRLV